MVVLMYHGVISDASQIPPDRERGAPLYDLPAAAFREQMDYLKKNSYKVERLEEAPAQAPVRKVVLTFDDGEMNNFTQAWPILKQYQFPAFFFVTTNRIGQKGYMGWPQLQELLKGGMIIGSHGLNHNILVNLSEEELKKELGESKRILEEHLKVSAEYFSVPRGFWNSRILRAAQQAGYTDVFVSENGFQSLENCIARIPVQNTWSLKRFEQALDGRRPFGEVLGKAFQGMAKKILGPSAYDGLRKRLLGKS